MNSFISPDEQDITDTFLKRGFIVQPAENFDGLSYLRYLVSPHEPAGDLNALKLAIMARLNKDAGARLVYYMLATRLLHTLVGSELAMQKKFNLNVQVPGDERNLLPIHADTWTGDSAYQVVLWVPFTDCYRTKSMWILPPGHAEKVKVEGTSEAMFRRIEPYIEYVNVKYGEVLLFNPTLPHGNRVNREEGTRWTLNCRFKGVFTPYERKGLGEHFEPITLRAASRIGLNYRHPA